MNKTILVVIVVILVLLLGGGIMYASSKKISNLIDNPSPTIDESSKSDNKPIASSQGTIKSLLNLGKSVTCSYSNSSDGANTQGTLFIANGKLRSNFTTTFTNQPETTGHMIVDSVYSYVWTDGLQQGIKFPIEKETTDSSPAAETKNQASDLNQSINYNCTDWPEDDSLFNPPEDITFQSFSVPTLKPTSDLKNLNQGSSISGSIAKDQCTVCNNIPAGSARDNCKTQLQCP